MTLEGLSVGLTVLTMLVYILLPFTYGIIAPKWLRTQTGRAVMWLLAALAVAMIYIAAGILFGLHEGRVALRIFTLIIVLTAGVRFLAYMFQTQFAAVREKKKT